MQHTYMKIKSKTSPTLAIFDNINVRSLKFFVFIELERNETEMKHLNHE